MQTFYTKPPNFLDQCFPAGKPFATLRVVANYSNTFFKYIIKNTFSKFHQTSNQWLWVRQWCRI